MTLFVCVNNVNEKGKGNLNLFDFREHYIFNFVTHKNSQRKRIKNSVNSNRKNNLIRAKETKLYCLESIRPFPQPQIASFITKNMR